MTPIVAIVGRPNVGKSTLFNRLVGRPLAIVNDQPGVTRDRHYAETRIAGRRVFVVDTGGFDPTTDDPMGLGIAKHVRAAIAEADVVLCVLDGSAPPMGPDREAVKLLRRSDKPVLYAANKVDGPTREGDALSVYELGIQDALPVSALHGRGFSELEFAIAEKLPSRDDDDDDDEAGPTDVPHVAILGRPNAGKSTLFNRLAGSERALVDERPGTTRDPIDTDIEFEGKRYVLVDTAGVRRRARVKEDVEHASVVRSIRTIERAQVIVLLCDAAEGMADQDAKLIGLATDRGAAIIVGLNKCDLLDKRKRAKAEESARDQLGFAKWAPIVSLSAKSGRGVRELMNEVAGATDEYQRRVPTGELNRFFEKVLERRQPPTRGRRAPRVYYLTQVVTGPPLFVAMASYAESIDMSYRRFVANQIREAFGFRAVPVRVEFRNRRRRER